VIALFFLAQWIKVLAARILAYSFYKTAHFAKLLQAIEKE